MESKYSHYNNKHTRFKNRLLNQSVFGEIRFKEINIENFNLGDFLEYNLHNIK